MRRSLDPWKISAVYEKLAKPKLLLTIKQSKQVKQQHMQILQRNIQVIFHLVTSQKITYI